MLRKTSFLFEEDLTFFRFGRKLLLENILKTHFLKEIIQEMRLEDVRNQILSFTLNFKHESLYNETI